MQLSRFPRSRFCHLPTPLEPMRNLTKALGGPSLWVKRDDCTGMAFGGNKTRKLEFLVAEALASGADTLVTAGGVQSNHCRQTAAVAARHGMKCELVLSRNVSRNTPGYDRTGNVLLDRMFGATIHFVPAGIDWAVELNRVADGARADGRKPFIMPIGGSTATGSLGYVGCAQEIQSQAAALGVTVDAIVHCTGSGATQAGLLVGLAGTADDIAVIGISVAEAKGPIEERVIELVGETARKAGLTVAIPDERIEVLDDYVGPGYGLPTEGMREALELCAHHEGLLLDPVYSGKAMAGMIDLVRKGRFPDTANVVFIHTGGTPALFAYEDAVLGDMAEA